MQTKIEVDAEILQMSLYCEFIIQILSLHKQLSLIKLIVFSFIVKNKNKCVYTSRDTNEITYKCLSILSGQYQNFLEDIPIIIKSIHLLNKNNRISIENSIVTPVQVVFATNQIYDKNDFLYKAISESKYIPDKHFMKEVINNV